MCQTYVSNFLVVEPVVRTEPTASRIHFSKVCGMNLILCCKAQSVKLNTRLYYQLFLLIIF